MSLTSFLISTATNAYEPSPQIALAIMILAIHAIVWFGVWLGFKIWSKMQERTLDIVKEF